jgi:phosphate:Na+ symporter
MTVITSRDFVHGDAIRARPGFGYMLTLAELLSGLGLLFIGLRLIGQHLRQAAGHRVRAAINTATASRWSGLLAGAMAGAVTQSSNAVTLITANLVHGRVLSVNQAAPVVAGANAGTALLVFLATLDLRLAVLYLVAAAGLSLHFKLDYHASRRDWIWAGLGLALLFMGLDFIKHAPDTLSVGDWHTLLGEGVSSPAALVLGVAIALVTQSASAGTILAVAALHTGFMRFDSALWIMTGANLGSGLAVLISGSGLKGSGRQLCLVHVIVKTVGSVLVAAAWMLYSLRTGDAGAAIPTERAASLLAVLFLAMQLAGALPLTLLRDSAIGLTARLTPADPVEQASQPHYIYDRAIEDPVNALDLARLERERLTVALPQLLPNLDADAADAPAARRHLLAGNRNVAAQTSAFLLAVIGQGLNREDLGRAAHEQSSLENVQSLQDTLAEFSGIVDAWRDERPRLLFNLCEALLTLVGLLADTANPAMGAPDPHDLEMLIQLSGDRGEMLERLRRQVMASETHDGAQTRELLVATRLFERAVWLVRRIAIARREHDVGPEQESIAVGASRGTGNAHQG